jgi:arginyl-tRNA synthetase
MNKLIKEIVDTLYPQLRKLGVSENIEFSVSKLPAWDLQINYLIKYKSHKAYEDMVDEIITVLKSTNYFREVELTEIGFINLKLNHKYLSSMLTNQSKDFQVSKPIKIIIDYGGPNLGKPLHVGHIRTLNIGRSLYNMNKFVGNEVVSDLHLGDWGMPIAQILCYLEINNESTDNISIDKLQSVYPKASLEYRNNQEFKNKAQEINKLLNNEDVNYISQWKKIKKISINSLRENFVLLNHQFDYWYGESDVNALIEPMLEDLKKNGKIVEDDNALISSENIEPRVLITKSDGSYLYITTDLATTLFRQNNIPYEKALYVVDKRQSLHFQQLFSSIKYFGFNDNQHEHIAYGTMNDKNGNPYKTRDGETKPLKELFYETYNYIKTINPSLNESNLNNLTNSVLSFSDLLTNRMTDYKFDLEKFTNISGKTGVYIQYAQVRAQKLAKHLSDVEPVFSEQISDNDQKLLTKLFLFGIYLDQSIALNEPHHLANYLYEICNLFNVFYEEEKLSEIIDQGKLSSKLYILDLFITTCHNTMFCLGITPVEEM